jgi:hypothetical protein
MICCKCEVPKQLWYLLDNKNYAVCCVCNHPIIPTPPVLTRYKKKTFNESSVLKKNTDYDKAISDQNYC